MATDRPSQRQPQREQEHVAEIRMAWRQYLELLVGPIDARLEGIDLRAATVDELAQLSVKRLEDILTAIVAATGVRRERARTVPSSHLPVEARPEMRLGPGVTIRGGGPNWSRDWA
jgi:hypothetical protein